MNNVVMEETESADMNNKNEKHLISEVNFLVSRKDYTSALNKLHHYLEVNQSTPNIQRVLGKIYLLNKQPEKAIKCLELAINRETKSKQKSPTGYFNEQQDDFDDEDLSYLEEQAVHMEEFDYDIEDNGSLNSVLSKESDRAFQDKTKTTTLKLKKKVNREANESNQETKISYKLGSHSKLNQFEPNQVQQNQTQPDQNQIENLHNVFSIRKNAVKGSPSLASNSSSLFTDLDPNDKKINLDLKINTIATETKKEIEKRGYSNKPQSKPQRDFFLDDLFDDEDSFEDNYTEKTATKEISAFSEIEDEYDEDEEWGAETESSNSNRANEQNDLDEYDEFDDLVEEEEDIFSDEDEELADLDDFDPEAAREDIEEVNLGKVSPFDKAKQIAASVIIETDWDITGLPLLQQIFFENGYSASRKAIVREIENGVTPDELSIARELRMIWKGEERFWTAFNHIKLNATGQQARAAYKNLSWAESLRIIRCFGNLPDLEEITEFLNELYELWYSSSEMMRCFKVFFKFLKYRLGHTASSLPGDVFFSFHEGYETDIAEDSPDFLSAISPKYQHLQMLGINLYERPYERRLDVQLDEELLNDAHF